MRPQQVIEGPDRPVRPPHPPRATGPERLTTPGLPDGERRRATVPCPPDGGTRNMRFRLVPSNDEFFGQFSRAAANLLTTVQGLRALVDDLTDAELKHARVKEAERAGDEVTREILRSLDTSFVTPF